MRKTDLECEDQKKKPVDLPKGKKLCNNLKIVILKKLIKINFIKNGC